MNDEYQGYFADCYVLTDKRTESFIVGFLDHFVPERRESVDEYEVTQYADNLTEKFGTAREVVKYLVNNKFVKHTLYWENPIESELRGAEIFFTDDGYVIIGLYCETKYPVTDIEDKYFKEIKEFCESDEGYITYEDTPSHNSEEFMEKVKSMKAQYR
ncbi:MAG: hypothetical protein AAFQ94_25595 [Bacteroidota bacterium]